MFTIPVIIISTVTGTANFAQEHFPDHRATMAMIIGGFNIMAAIITTISQFLKIAEVNESHRVATLSWGRAGTRGDDCSHSCGGEQNHCLERQYSSSS